MHTPELGVDGLHLATRAERQVRLADALHPVRGLVLLLRAVPSHLDESRALLNIVELLRPDWWLLLELLLIPLVGVALFLGGVAWGGLLLGAAVALALSRYGPHWWPGKR